MLLAEDSITNQNRDQNNISADLSIAQTTLAANVVSAARGSKTILAFTLMHMALYVFLTPFLSA